MKVKTQYKVFEKDNYNFLPIWKREKDFGGNKTIYNSLDDLNNKIKGHDNWNQFDGGYELLGEKVKKTGSTIYTFLSHPHGDSIAARNPDKFKKHIVSLKIVPVISLEDLKE